MVAGAPPPGTEVVLRNLVSRPELNGSTATVLAASHSKEAAAGYEKGRVPVRLSDGGGTMTLKPEALEVIPEPPAMSKLAPEWSNYSYEQLCTMGWEYFENGVVMLAIECYQQAILLEPETVVAHFQLAQVHEASPDVSGSQQLAARLFLTAMDLVAPEAKAPNYSEWTHAFVRAANLLTSMPSASKPEWWCPNGIKQRCGLLLSNPQGLLPDSSLICPAWRLMAHAFEMEIDVAEAARCYEEAAGYCMDQEQCQGLMRRSKELREELARA